MAEVAGKQAIRKLLEGWTGRRHGSDGNRFTTAPCEHDRMRAAVRVEP